MAQPLCFIRYALKFPWLPTVCKAALSAKAQPKPSSLLDQSPKIRATDLYSTPQHIVSIYQYLYFNVTAYHPDPSTPATAPIRHSGPESTTPQVNSRRTPSGAPPQVQVMKPRGETPPCPRVTSHPARHTLPVNNNRVEIHYITAYVTNMSHGKPPLKSKLLRLS